MLGTLLKYELKAVGRIMLPLYGAWIVLSVLFAAMMMIAPNVQVPSMIAGILYGVVTALVVLMTIILIIQRFYKNLLGNEGYLMMTLPVTAGEHIANKVISAAIWVMAGCLVGLVSVSIVFLIYGYQGNFPADMHSFMSQVMALYGVPKTILVIVEIIALALLCFGEAAVKIYAAIALGHQWSSHRVIGAIGAYIGFGIIEVVLMNVVSKIGFLGNISQSLTFNVGGFAGSQLEMLMIAAVAAILMAIYWFVTWILLTRRLNLQ